MDLKNLNYFMDQALEEAQKGERIGEVPIGALIVKDGEIIARASNIKESSKSPTGHAEIEVINMASKKLDNWRLLDCTLIVTLEPCPMCLAAMIQARIKRLVFGAYDPKGGAISLGYNLYDDPRLNHSLEVIGGLNQLACGKLISEFFRNKRNQRRE